MILIKLDIMIFRMIKKQADSHLQYKNKLSNTKIVKTQRRTQLVVCKGEFALRSQTVTSVVLPSHQIMVGFPYSSRSLYI